jgi:hypothetical protein
MSTEATATFKQKLQQRPRLSLTASGRDRTAPENLILSTN